MAVYPELGRRKTALLSLVIFSSWTAEPAWQQKAEWWRGKRKGDLSKPRPHLRSGAEKLFIKSCEKCWGLSLPNSPLRTVRLF
jgi:hypothetical protein